MGKIKTLVKVVAQNALIILIFLIVTYGIDLLGNLIGNSIAFAFAAWLVTWPVLFLAFFYSNAELCKGIKNNYLWSLSSGIPSILLTIGTVMYATHNT